MGIKPTNVSGALSSADTLTQSTILQTAILKTLMPDICVQSWKPYPFLPSVEICASKETEDGKYILNCRGDSGGK